MQENTEGDVVENCGALCRLEKIDKRGALLEIVAAGEVGQRFYADPAKCGVTESDSRGILLAREMAKRFQAENKIAKLNRMKIYNSPLWARHNSRK